ncbi:MAG TPA: response regulator [Tepidisphaeraceae bacterium]|jgi:DNA-binding NarL/FixJ family response regulator
MPIRILDVGQCGFDGPRMAKLWRERLGAEVVDSNSADDALQQIKQTPFDVVLVNRVLAGDGASGLEVIESIVKAAPETPVMLVSDLPDAQDDAVARGARRGFGKAALGDPSTLELVERTARGE